MDTTNPEQSAERSGPVGLQRLVSPLLTEAQQSLMNSHGTPAEFARACYAAVPGFVSVDETAAAVRKYGAEWEAAGKQQADKPRRYRARTAPRGTEQMPSHYESELEARKRVAESGAPALMEEFPDYADAGRRPSLASSTARGAEPAETGGDGRQPLAALRKLRGLKQQEVADRAGITRTYLSLLENGHAESVTLPVARRIARALGAHVDDCFSPDYGEAPAR